MLDETSRVKIRENANRIVNFLKNKGISIPDQEMFLRNCVLSALYAGPHNWQYLGKKDVDNCVDMANFWRDAIKDENEYVVLIQNIIYSLYRLQSCAINNNSQCERLYLGRFCKVNSDSELAQGSREYNLKRTYVGVGSKAIVKA